MARFSKGPWRAALTTIRGHQVWSVRNTHRDPVAIVYTNEDDARLMAASLRMLSELKHAEASLRMREGELRASEKAMLARIRALLAELNNGGK